MESIIAAVLAQSISKLNSSASHAHAWISPSARRRVTEVASQAQIQVDSRRAVKIFMFVMGCGVNGEL